jgi:hypothetical protein
LWPASPDGDRQVAFASVYDGSHDVSRVQALGDEQRTLIDHAVVQGTRLVVIGVIAIDDPAAETLTQVANGVH